MPAAIVIGSIRELTEPRAIVPSWHDRHSLLEPVGWPGWALRLLLAYTLYEVTGRERFHRGCTGVALCGV